MARRTISGRPSEAAGRDFVGRGRELALIRDAVRAPGADVRVVLVHGPAGIGKSALLRAAVRSAVPPARGLILDCRDVEPTQPGVHAAVAGALGPGGAPGRTVIALDAYEALGPLDGWMRRRFLPALPASVLTLIAARDRPGEGWPASRELRLGPLGRGDSIALLRGRGLTQAQAGGAYRLAGGHPLALQLAPPPPAPGGGVLDALAAGLGPETLATLRAAATVRRVTEPALAALLGRRDVGAELAELRRLPVVEAAPGGLRLHDAVREALRADLAGRDPEAEAAYRRRALRHLAGRARRRAGADRWGVTADLADVVTNPVVRSARGADGAVAHLVEPALPADGPAVREIVAAQEPAAAGALLLRRLERHPHELLVARAPDGSVEAVLHLAELAAADAGPREGDPVARAWRDHLAAVPPRPRDRVLAVRRWLGRESGEMPSPAVAACWAHAMRACLELRPRLSRLYSALGNPAALAPALAPLGVAAIGPAVDVGGTTQQPVWLDLGEGGVDGWLARLAGAEIDAAEEGLAAARASADLGGLSPREVEVLALIAEGLSNRAIGERLAISDKTVGRHVSNVFAKLRVHNRSDAARIAAERGLVGGR